MTFDSSSIVQNIQIRFQLDSCWIDMNAYKGDRIDFSAVCRVCCMSIDERSLPIFRVNLFRKIMTCASVQVWQNDGLPGRVCRKCAAKLHVSYQFKRLCERSDVILRQCRDSGNFVIGPKIVDNHNDVFDFSNELEIETDAILNAESPMHDFFSFPEFTTGPSEDSIDIDFHSQDLDMSSAPIASIQTPTYDIDRFNPDYEKKQEEEKGSPKEIVDEVEINEPEEPEMFKCPICDKAFSTPAKLSRHSRTHSDEVSYRCEVCNKGFIHGGNFKVHMRIHNDERPFSCPYCEMKCRQRQDLNKHMRIHTGERPFECFLCRKSFTTSSNLVAHERIHRGEKPYICPICQKGFCQSNELSKHVRTHTGEKSHVCSICSKGFNGSSSLIIHMRQHTGEKPYICTVCNKGFSQTSYLAIHLKTHETTQSHLCTTCGRSFSTSEDLQHHFETHSPPNIGGLF